MVVRVACPTPDHIVPVDHPVPQIHHFSIEEQQVIVLKNARVTRMGGDKVALITSHYFEILREFWGEVVLDSKFAHQKVMAAYHA